jgi:hypothetical protein
MGFDLPNAVKAIPDRRKSNARRVGFFMTGAEWLESDRKLQKKIRKKEWNQKYYFILHNSPPPAFPQTGKEK